MGKLRFDRVVLDYSARRRAADGSLIVPGQFARSGLQTYRNPDGSERIEYRPAAMVRASASTFEGVSITDEHPGTFVNADNWTQLAKGHLQNVEAVDDDGETWLRGQFHFKARDLIDRVERGEKPELSGGYFADEVPIPGEYKGQPYHCEQADVVGNHVASIAQGTARAGRGARLLLDSTGNQLPPGGDESPAGVRRDGKEKQMNEFELKLGGIPFRFTADATARAALEQELEHGRQARADGDTRVAEVQRKVDALTAERDREKGRADSASGTVDSLTAELADARDPAKLDARAAARSELVRQALALGAKRDALRPKDGKAPTDREIRIAGLRAAGVKVDAKASDEWIAGALEAEARHQDALERAGVRTVADLADDAVSVDDDEREDSDPMQPLWDARDRAARRDAGEED
ncbi:DUF2213 domain-containing protein [Zavarzinia sp.]|uniref:DUF2213 domain-containing protein n=1 Tax=Zavarzinia sp. TaxID=2027920 RepID=UPI0035649C3E